MDGRATIRIEDDSTALYFGSFLSRYGVLYSAEVNEGGGYTYSLYADDLVDNIERTIDAVEWGSA